jgi:hypothetical protein
MHEITPEMLREAFQQTQREILEIATPERYHARWERMAELLNEKLVEQSSNRTQALREEGREHLL